MPAPLRPRADDLGNETLPGGLITGPPIPPESVEELYEHAPCGYVTTLPDGTLVRCNATFLALIGYSREALLGRRRLQDLLTLPGRIYWETHLSPLIRMQGLLRDVSVDFVRADDARAPAILHATLQTDDAGNPVSIRATVFDATDRRRYERELLEARRRAERFARMVESATDAIVGARPDGIVLTWNHGAERLFGYTAEEAVGKSLRELIVPPSHADEYEQKLTLLRSGQEAEFETVRLRKDGVLVEVSIRWTPIVEALGEVDVIFAIMRDITERRRMEEQLRRTERLQVVGTLAGGVAHEVNNQMTVVLGFGDFLARGLGADHPHASDLGHMLDAAKRAARISEQLLAFGRRRRLVPRPVDLYALAGELVPVLVCLLGADKSLVLAPRRGASIARVDPTAMEQVLINLVANARDAIASAGRVTIRVDDAVLTEADAHAHPNDDVAPGAYVRLSVTDTGAGMDPPTLARVFEPFFTTKAVGAGTGLGLPMVHGLVKQHGGQIWVSSARGLGTDVRVYLPAVAPAVQPRPSEAIVAAAAAAAGGSVLVVDDEPLVREVGRRALDRAGMIAHVASSGPLALDLMERLSPRPDLVVTDVLMPEMNGRQLGEAIRQRWPDVRLLFMSGYSADDMRSRQMLDSDAPFLQKPFTTDDLVRLVGELLPRASRR